MRLLEARLHGFEAQSEEVTAFLQEKASMLRRAVEMDQTLEAERFVASQALRQLPCYYGPIHGFVFDPATIDSWTGQSSTTATL